MLCVPRRERGRDIEQKLIGGSALAADDLTFLRENHEAFGADAKREIEKQVRALGRPGDALEYTAASGVAAFIVGPADESVAVYEAPAAAFLTRLGLGLRFP